MATTITYPLDLTGLSASNLVIEEPDVLTAGNADAQRFLVPRFAPFYLNKFKITIEDINGVISELKEGIDFNLCLLYLGATRSTGKLVYGGITILNTNLVGNVKITYQTIGGEWTGDKDYVLTRLLETNYNPRLTVWDVVTDKPNQFPPSPHKLAAGELLGFDSLVSAVNSMSASLIAGPSSTTPIVVHLTNNNNPHNVTKRQVGLPDVENLPVATDADIASLVGVRKYVTLEQVLQLLVNYQKIS